VQCTVNNCNGAVHRYTGKEIFTSLISLSLLLLFFFSHNRGFRLHTRISVFPYNMSTFPKKAHVPIQKSNLYKFFKTPRNFVFQMSLRCFNKMTMFATLHMSSPNVRAYNHISNRNYNCTNAQHNLETMKLGSLSN
jgi:hypothetical protein